MSSPNYRLFSHISCRYLHTLLQRKLKIVLPGLKSPLTEGVGLLGGLNGVQVASGGCCFTSHRFTTVHNQTSTHEDQPSTPHRHDLVTWPGQACQRKSWWSTLQISGQVKATETASIFSFWPDFNPRQGYLGLLMHSESWVFLTVPFSPHLCSLWSFSVFFILACEEDAADADLRSEKRPARVHRSAAK